MEMNFVVILLRIDLFSDYYNIRKNTYYAFYFRLILHKKMKFSINPMNTSSSIRHRFDVEIPVSCGFGHIYWRNPYDSLHFLCSATSHDPELSTHIYSKEDLT